jgi:mRNA interferase MazF
LTRAELYRVHKPTRADPRRSRVCVVVSRQIAIESKFSTVICAPVYSSYEGLSTQVAVGVAEGLKHDSSIHCDELVSMAKPLLTDFVGRLVQAKLRELDNSLAIAVGLK